MFTLRPFEHAELTRIVEVINAAHLADGVPEVLAADELVEEIEDLDIAMDTRVAQAADGTIVGAAYLAHLGYDQPDAALLRCYVFGDVDPRWRRQGVGSALMRWAIERATQALRAVERDAPRSVRAQLAESTQGGAELMATMEMVPSRVTEILERPLDQALTVPAPARVRIVDWPDDRDEEIRQAKNAAFTDHWGSTPTSPDTWATMVRGSVARPDLSVIALDQGSGEVIGHCLVHRYETDDALVGRSEAWIDNLGTVAAHRGRGIAAAMIASALERFRAAGLDTAMIAVDSESLTGAQRLYRTLGFVVQRRSITYARDVERA